MVPHDSGTTTGRIIGEKVNNPVTLIAAGNDGLPARYGSRAKEVKLSMSSTRNKPGFGHQLSGLGGNTLARSLENLLPG